MFRELHLKYLCVCIVALAIGVVPGRGEARSVSFSIDASCTTGPVITPLLYGLNVARWDHQMYPTTGTAKLQDFDTTATARLKDLGLGFLKYPGGNDADSYIWNSPDNQPHDMDTDEYLDLQSKVGVPGFFTVNYTQTPQLAADWVRYILRVTGKKGAVPFWEVGDEVWGPWAKSHTSGANYAKKFLQFSEAMRSVDPTLQLAANLHLADPDTSWTRDALENLGDSFSVITTTFFPLSPPNERDEELFKAPDHYRVLFTRLKAFIARSRPGKPLPKFCLVGLNSTSAHPGPQTVEMANAVYMAQMYGAMAETGTDMSCWWAFHNEWKPRGGDFGIVASTPENQPYYTYYVMKLLAHNFLGKVVAAQRDGRIEMYASKPEPGSIAVLLINTSPTESAEVKIKLGGSGPRVTSKVANVELVTSATMQSGNTHAPAEFASTRSAESDASSVVAVRTLTPYSVAVVRLSETP